MKQSFKNFYKLPLHADKYGCYAWTTDDTIALMFSGEISDIDREKIISTINGDEEHKISSLKIYDGNFFDGDNYLFCVRGWGNLTGIGAHNLDYKTAAKIQDDFIEFIYKKLKL